MPTEDFKETVKQQADIVRIIGDYIKLKKAGAQNYSGLCPFHGEKTPSFSVHATRQFYHCFGCGVSGDVFSFVQKIENITFPEAVRLVAQKLGIPLPKASYSSPAEAQEAKLRAQLLDVHERAATFFQECLKRPEGASAREYLAGRGLDEETIARFRIGYAPDSGFLLRDRLAGEFSEEVLRESGLFSWKQEEQSQPQPSALWTGQPQQSGSDTSDRGSRKPKPKARSPKRRHVLQIPQPRNVPHRQRRRTSHRLHRTHPRHRRKIRPEVSELAGDRRSIPKAGSCSISTTPKKPSANSITPSWSKARWIAFPSTPPDFTT